MNIEIETAEMYNNNDKSFMDLFSTRRERQTSRESSKTIQTASLWPMTVVYAMYEDAETFPPRPVQLMSIKRILKLELDPTMGKQYLRMSTLGFSRSLSKPGRTRKV
jgi:hypothetical protein